MKVTPSNWNFQPQLTRRNILRGAPAAALTLTAGTTALAAPAADPIVALHREWLEARNHWAHLAGTSPSGDADEPECEDAWDRKEAALFAIMRSQATSAEGIRLLAHVMWEEEGWTAEGPAEDLADNPGQLDSLRLLKAIIRSAEGMTDGRTTA